MLGYCGVQPGEEDPFLPDPSNATTIAAIAIFGGIRVTWAMPISNPQGVAYTVIYRSTLDDPDTAIQIAISNTDYYEDQVLTATQYYYWIRFISINGTVGNRVGSASATAEAIAPVLLGYLAGNLGFDQLTPAVQSMLGGASVVAADLATETAARILNDTALSDAIAAIDSVADGYADAMAAEVAARISGDAALAGTSGALSASVTSLSDLFTPRYNAEGLIHEFNELDNSTPKEPAFDLSAFKVGTLAANMAAPFEVNAGAVYLKASMLLTDSITTAKILAGAVNTEKVAANSITKVVHGSFAATTLSASSSVTLGSVTLDMGTLDLTGNSGVTLVGQVSYTPAADSVNELKVVRNSDSVIIGTIVTSARNGWPTALTVAAYDSAPTSGNNVYNLVLVNPSSGAGSAVASTVETSTLQATGLKR